MVDVDIAALMSSLPVSGLEPQWVASIGGFVEVPKDRDWQERIWLLEPPAGQQVPYIEPIGAIEKLLRHQGVDLDDAKSQAREAIARIKHSVEVNRWVHFFDHNNPESPECIPVPEFVSWLRDDISVQPVIADFFEQVAEVVASTPMFRGPDNWNEPWSLEGLPALPPPEAMIEFMPGAPWADIDAWGDWRVTDNAFRCWREAIRPIALELEQALGEPVYYFADLSSDIDDDAVHRFLVLHWCCTYKPDSAFVRYLLKVSGARDVEELKAALINPANYTQPFKMNDAFIGLEVLSCHIDYLPPNASKTVAVVFATPEAREVAQSLLTQKIGAHALIVAPTALATKEWVEQATRFCRSWTVIYLHADTLDEPIDILALADELCVIANEKTPGSGFDLKLSEGAENLLWLALALGIETAYFYIDRTQLRNPEVCLEHRGAPERVAARKAQRTAFTRHLHEIRLDNDFGSSGLWCHDGKMLGYDLLDLPFPLVRRIAAWQRDYDYTLNSPEDMGDDAWGERHDQEAFEIARDLQAALGPEVAVKLYRREGWLTVDQIAAAEAKP